MSNHSGFSFITLSKRFVRSSFDEPVVSALLGKDCDVLLDPKHSDSMHLFGRTRGDAFKQLMRELLSRSEVRGLGFFSETTYDHSDIVTDAIEMDGVVYGHTRTKFEYALLRGERIDESIAAVRALFAWCAENAEDVYWRIGCRSAEDLRYVVLNAHYTLKPNDSPECEEGDTALFLFCTLHTFQNMLLAAAWMNRWCSKHGMPDGECIGVYTNDQSLRADDSA